MANTVGGSSPRTRKKQPLDVTSRSHAAGRTLGHWESGCHESTHTYGRDSARLYYADKSQCRWLSLNRSQCGGCSTIYDTPTQRTKSSAGDSTPLRCIGYNMGPCAGELKSPRRGRLVLRLRHGPRSTRTGTTVRPGRTPYSNRETLSLPLNDIDLRCLQRIVEPHAGQDSDLEAFSHNPTEGSLAPLPSRPST